MLSRKEVEHIADLAKIKLDKNNLEKFQRELSAVLEFVKKLQEIDTDGIEPVNGGTVLENIFREDNDYDQPDDRFRDKFLSNVPQSENGYLKVKRILEK